MNDRGQEIVPSAVTPPRAAIAPNPPPPAGGYRWQTTARAAGWAPIAEVLDALRNRGALAEWLEQHGRFVWPDGPTLDIAARYLADRFGVKENTDG